MTESSKNGYLQMLMPGQHGSTQVQVGKLQNEETGIARL